MKFNETRAQIRAKLDERRVVTLHGELRGGLILPPGVRLWCAPGSSIGPTPTPRAALRRIADHGYMSAQHSKPQDVVRVADWMVDTARAGFAGRALPELADM